jgi:hypothetical protein
MTLKEIQMASSTLWKKITPAEACIQCPKLTIACGQGTKDEPIDDFEMHELWDYWEMQSDSPIEAYFADDINGNASKILLKHNRNNWTLYEYDEIQFRKTVCEPYDASKDSPMVGPITMVGDGTGDFMANLNI